MDCRVVQEKISLYLDGELSPSELQLMEKHLETCATCQAELSSLKQTVALLKRAKPITSPFELKDKIWARIETNNDSSTFKERKLIPAWPRAGGRWIRSLSAAAVLLVAAVLIGKNVFGPAVDSNQIADHLSEGIMEEMGQAEAPAIDDARAVEKSVPMLMKQGIEELAPASRKIIQTAHLTLMVENLDQALSALEEVVLGTEGFIQNSNIYHRDDGRGAYYTIRVPATRLDQVLVQLETLGQVQNKGTDADDITEDYIDVEARQRNLLRQEERLLTILGQATTVEDILEVETQLERVRGEIELLTGRLRYLDNQISLSTINVELRERQRSVTTVQLSVQDGFGSRLKESFTGSVNLLLDGLSKTAIWLVAALPFILLGLGLGALGWFLFRHVKRKP